jgi:hypothetical protein
MPVSDTGFGKPSQITSTPTLKQALHLSLCFLFCQILYRENEANVDVQYLNKCLSVLSYKFMYKYKVNKFGLKLFG